MKKNVSDQCVDCLLAILVTCLLGNVSGGWGIAYFSIGEPIK
jgi:hypothetical protein